ncbi:hypothetical protein [Alkalihalobacillus trypoxylicola]|uniref:Uncharacterized protein n=1 Tax=Alkalihalobacillus trypoxylicola TaxID=519424 RepID=A0A161PL81_9BACI|nr:hypothetical protein [Alkalihalobacillus trypoxylicola]KYG34337.1 hypothetical protein AZF04_14180 [Alkalihalobacillus trypoxylicola]
MDYDFYINPNHWIGGFYELSIEYNRSGHNKRVNDGFAALCKSHYFNGVWENKKDYQKKSISLPINIQKDSVTSFYGTLSLSNSKEEVLPCAITVIRVEGESDWLDIAIPQAAIEKRFPYKYPLTIELNPWLKKVNERYTQLAELIYCSSPFDLAIIGEEISGHTNQENITYEVMKNITCILPIHLQDRFGVKEKGKELSNQLKIFD